jgi:hypothetical protein
MLLRSSTLLLALAAVTSCRGAEKGTRRDAQVPPPRPVAEIVQIEDDTKVAIAMSDLVFSREAAVGYERLTPPERVVYCLDGLEREVNNGGFTQFFANSAGDHALETIEALRTLGAPRVAELVAAAVAVFPDGHPAADRDDRQRQVDQLDEAARAKLDQLDSAFYENPENLAALERAYVSANQDQFPMP